MIRNYLLLFLFLLLSFILFLPSFSLALFGDDWLTLWRYFTNLGPNSSEKWNHVSYFFTSYGPQDILMGNLQKIYGYESTYYYLTSYILRILAALSLIPLMSYLTKSRFATLFSVGFFLLTPVGIETTNWVFNMPSYIAIIFLNLFLYYFFTSRLHLHKIIPASIFFFLALVSQPIRMHGLLPTVFILELFWIIQHRHKLILQRAAFRILVLTLISIPTILSLENSPIATVSNIFTHSLTFKPEYILNPFITLGGIIFPSDIIMSNFPTELYLFLFLMGVFFLIIASLFFLRFYNTYNISTGIFLSLSWLIISFIIAWWREPHAVFFTTHRYLIVAAVGISIFLGILVSLLKNSKSKLVLWLLISSMTILHIYSTRSYLINAKNAHSQNISKKIWASIPYIPKIGKSSEPVVFYFEGDGTNEAILHDVITFGFPPHMGLIYNISEEDKLPITVSEAKELISAATAVSIERIYAFQLSGNNGLIDITEAARKSLTELKK